jgi:hypothetical protein
MLAPAQPRIEIASTRHAIHTRLCKPCTRGKSPFSNIFRVSPYSSGSCQNFARSTQSNSHEFKDLREEHQKKLGVYTINGGWPTQACFRLEWASSIAGKNVA